MEKFIFKYFLIVVISLFTISCSKSDLTNNQTPSGTVTDIDGNVYHSVKIGTQTWMVENLKTTKYRNGDLIPNITNGSAWISLTSGAYCWNSNDAASYKAAYGALYNGYAVRDSRNIAPAGWHVPSDAEWKTLILYLDANADFTDISGGFSTVVGIKLKEVGNAHWTNEFDANANSNATNETGFTALPGGMRGNWDWGPGIVGPFDGIGSYGCWFSSTENVSEPNNIWVYQTYSDYCVYRETWPMVDGISVRCVKD